MSREPESGRMSGKRLVTILMVFLVLILGIGIGTIISYRVDAVAPGDSQLKIQTDGKPLVGSAVLALSQAFEEVSNRVESAVVNINTEEVVRRSQRRTNPQAPFDTPQDDPMQDFFNRFFNGMPQMPEQYTRRSVIVDPKGYIITNNHVVANATKIKVNVSGGEEYTGKIIGGDALSDIAVIKIDAGKDLPFAKIGDAKAMKAGDWVIAVGSPFGLEQTVTAGIISASGRMLGDRGEDQMRFNDYLQTDAAINPGNSGGPLVNMNGEVVGINSFINTQSGSNAGVGFAVPAHIFVNVYNQILEKGKVSRGWLGVSMNTPPFTPAMAKFFGVKQGSGVLITQLIDEKGNPSDSGPAAKAGIKPEDVITEFDGKKIYSTQDVVLAVANALPGRKATVKIVRHGEEKVLDVVLAERLVQTAEEGNYSFEAQAEQPKPEIGLSFDNVPSQMMQALDITGGALVLSVKPGSLAEEAGLMGQEQGAGDVILEANGRKINAAQDLLNIVKDLKTGEAAVLKFIRIDGRAPNSSRVIASPPIYTSITKP
jgi:serine protease Do